MAKRTAKTSQEPIWLDWVNHERPVVVSPSNQDKFVLKMRDAVEACIAYDPMRKTENAIDEITAAILGLLELLGKWSEDHHGSITNAFLTLRDGRLLFLVVMRETEYNKGLEDDLTSLDLKIAHSKHFEKIPLSVQALPACKKVTFRAFLNPVLTFKYHME